MLNVCLFRFCWIFCFSYMHILTHHIDLTSMKTFSVWRKRNGKKCSIFRLIRTNLITMRYQVAIHSKFWKKILNGNIGLCFLHLQKKLFFINILSVLGEETRDKRDSQKPKHRGFEIMNFREKTVKCFCHNCIT